MAARTTRSSVSSSAMTAILYARGVAVGTTGILLQQQLSDMEMSRGNALGSLGCFWPKGEPKEAA